MHNLLVSHIILGIYFMYDTADSPSFDFFYLFIALVTIETNITLPWAMLMEMYQ